MAATPEALPGIGLEQEYTFRAVLEGLSPLLMAHPRGMEPEEAETELKSSRAKRKVLTPEEEAEGKVYRDPFGALYIPVLAINRAMVEAGKAFQDPANKRATLAKSVAAGIYMPEYEGYGLTRDDDPIVSYEIDTRRVVNKTTKGAILASRPKIVLPWTCSVEFTVDPDRFDPIAVARILQTAGKKIGVLAFRPEKLGPFGRFRVADYGTEGIEG